MGKVKNKPKFTLHCLDRARERYNLDLTEFDLIIIGAMLYLGMGKEIVSEGRGDDVKCFHLRYSGKLLKIIIKDVKTNPTILTFLPAGKKVSRKKYVEKHIDKDWKNMVKRKKRNK